MPFNPRSYGPAVAALVENARCNELGPGVPDAHLRASLAALLPETITAPRPLQDRDMAMACVAGLWLRHDFLDESHHVSQSIENPSGSYWHGIMHRREGDFENAKYWFRHVGRHAVCAPLALAAKALAEESPLGRSAGFLRSQADWDPFRFIDLCRRPLDDSPPERAVCMKIQQCEW